MARLEAITPEQIAQSNARIQYLEKIFAGAPNEFQPVIPQGTPREVPFTEGQMIAWDHIKNRKLPVKPQIDMEFFIRLGCRWDCTNCSVPEHIRHAPEVLMRPEFWKEIFTISEGEVIQTLNPNFKGEPGTEPELAPYVRAIGGEPSTYHPSGKENGQAVSYGDIVDVMSAARNCKYLMAGLFSDGASLSLQPKLVERLVPVLERYQTSVDYHPKDTLPDLKSAESTDRDNRASYGAHMAAYFASQGIDAVANMVLIPPDPQSGERGNLDQVLSTSLWLWERGVSTLYVPVIWREHRAQHGRKESAYATELQLHHSPLLKEIVEQLVAAQLSGIGKIRNSRAYIEGIPYAGVDQLIGWWDIPKTISISPNGRMGYDPVFKTMAEVIYSPGGYYGYEDHQGKWVNFRGDQYLPMLERELHKWEEVVASRRAVATRVDPVALIETINNAISHWESNSHMLKPSNNSQGEWWDNTIKNTKVGKYKGVYRSDIKKP